MPTHKDFVIDRQKKIEAMIKAAENSAKEKAALLADPAGFAKKHGVVLSDEEVHGIQANSGDLPELRTRMMAMPRPFFDQNCGCGGGGPACW